MSRKQVSLAETVFQVCNYTFLVAISLSFVVPFLVVLSSSLVSESELIRRGNLILLPQHFDFTAYKVLLSKGSTIYNAYGITLLRVTVGTFLNLLLTSMMAYGLSRKGLPGRNGFITLVFITMLIGGGLIPTYLLLKGLQLLDTFWVMILPGLISAWNLIIMRNFFMQIPVEMEESATIDGASPFGILVRIVLPLSLPTFATIGLFYAVGHWNAWFDATIYINNTRLQPLQVILRQIVLSMTSEELNTAMMVGMMEKPTAQSLKAAVIIITTLPILCVYPFLQKHFAKGVLTGSIKG
ncbi:carbohydrate ABC transporter permease [Paenibacillus eucommiae]|uniref:Aldouronate transport system permease protein n=1 Tax=Paenibacillus eucommiae TaxID=1355755 RepID=A0ABS4IPI2_9BACL|nr:carbohydrate ABC transporter permease [Paenibacillus eucommiae]MBP1989469.1 putative aldouronate transport system permease protein [Paenibacillus eucommiae]